MQYNPPRILATYAATSAIQSAKDQIPLESDGVSLTQGPAYQSEE